VGLSKNIRRGLGCSLAISYLRWEMTPRLVSDIICGVGILLLRTLFQIYLALRVRKMLLLWHTLSSRVAPLSRM
jgi:hypothetical protein